MALESTPTWLLGPEISPSARIGTAAIIEDYQFLRSNGAPDFFSALQKEWKATN